MIEYIYWVKCPDCEDEHFYFFDEAKEFALSCLSKKPIITQTEVNRNDFGECTDHCDLGTVWSWEEMMQDTTAEPEPSVFTKDDLRHCDCDGKCGGNCKCGKHDSEFEDDDPEFKLVNEELVESRKISFKDPADQKEFFNLCSEIGLVTAADLDRFMKDQNADDSNVLDKLRDYRAELGDDFEIKEACRKPIPEGMTIEELVEEMEENEDTVECAWCNDLFDKSECRKEVDLGWLCSRCEMAIKSRGETLTFREGNYWDFLDEEVDEPKIVDDLGNTYDGGYPEGDVELDESAVFLTPPKMFLLKRIFDKFGEAKKASKWIDYKKYIIEKTPDGKINIWDFNGNELFSDLHTVKAAKQKIQTLPKPTKLAKLIAQAKNLVSSEIKIDTTESDGSLSTDAIEEEVQPSMLEELEDADTYRDRLELCPECGANESYDRETGICINCGFN